MHALSEIMLRAHTALFAQKVSRVFEDLTGFRFEVEAKSLSKGHYQSSGTFTVFMHFWGRIQGSFFLTSVPETAEAIVKQSSPTLWDKNGKSGVSEYFGEMLNVASGQTVPELEKKYGPLTLTPPYSVIGELCTPEVLSGIVDIIGKPGKIQCTVSVNLASMQIIDKMSNAAT